MKMEKKSLIEELHGVQDENKKTNYISEEKAAQCGGGSPASGVYSVATFYTMFSLKPRGKHIIRVCRNISCHLEGAEKISEKLKEVLGIDFGQTTSDGLFTLEESSCLGMCSISPAIMIDETPYGNLDSAKIDEIIKTVKAGGKQ